MMARRIANTVVAVASVVAIVGAVAVPSTSGATVVWSWVDRTPSISPPSRAAAASAYDSARSQLVVFGGWNIDSGLLSDTWVYDGSTWSQPSTPTAPSARWFAAMAFDPIHGVAILFGGCCQSSAGSAETWQWDGTQWTLLHPTTSPPARLRASMVWDSARQRIVMFGGNAGGAADLNDLWVWDGTNWTQDSPVTALPHARYSAAAAYDGDRQRLVIFGGFESNVGFVNDTWEWDAAARTWTQQTPVNVPLTRASAMMTFDPIRHVSLLFGGDRDDSSYLGDLWRWDGSNWTQLSLSPAPGSRRLATFVYATETRGELLFSGDSFPSPTCRICAGGQYSDTWELESAPAVPMPSAGFAPASTVGAITIPVREQWVADPDPPICSYQLQQSAAGGPYTDVTLPTPTSTSVVLSLSPSTTYSFRLSATDCAGISSGWGVQPTFSPLAWQESSSKLKYIGTWTRKSIRSAYGGALKFSTAKDASVSETFFGTGVAWVSETGPTLGKATVYVDGVAVKTVNLYNATLHPRQLVWKQGWSMQARHTIKIVVNGTAGHPRVDLDAILTLHLQ